MVVAVSSPLSTLMAAPAAQSLPPRPAPVRHLRKQKWICRINPTIDFPCLRFGSCPLFLGISLELPSFHDFHPTSSWVGSRTSQVHTCQFKIAVPSIVDRYMVAKWIADSPCRFMAMMSFRNLGFVFLRSPDLLACIAFFVTCLEPVTLVRLLRYSLRC